MPYIPRWRARLFKWKKRLDKQSWAESDNLPNVIVVIVVLAGCQ
ncbi:MAG TPA: hypothetical protein VFZ34_22800 [Blastocatellia bacterium]|nr:hypothetical protein [Blastocatellia bacterium]